MKLLVLSLIGFSCTAAVHAQLSPTRILTLPAPAVTVSTNKPAKATLAWDASTDAVEGYRLHWGQQPNVYTNSVKIQGAVALSTTVTNLLTGRTYYFVATAYAGESESRYSNMVAYQVPLQPYEGDFYLLPITLLTSPNGKSPWRNESVVLASYTNKSKTFITVNMRTIRQ